MFAAPRYLGRFGAKVGVVSDMDELRRSEATTDTKTLIGETKSFGFTGVLAIYSLLWMGLCGAMIADQGSRYESSWLIGLEQGWEMLSLVSSETWLWTGPD